MKSIKQLYQLFLKQGQICTDTRAIKQGAIYFALKGENFNGNKFASKALEEGCSIAVIDEKDYLKGENYFLVDDVLKTLQQLATYHREQLKIPVIGITGSNGKTTTKELIATVLNKKYKTLATQGNLNNHIGVPLTILSITNEYEMAVIEMGANHIGEIEMLCQICQPEYGIITNIGKAHLEGFGGYEGVIKAKSELYHFIKERKGKLFVNAENSLLQNLSSRIEKITYGFSENCECQGELISADPFIELKFQNEIIKSHLIGKYNFENILAAICIGSYFKVEKKEIKKAIEEYIPSNNRSQVLKKESNTIFLDAYNANPTSMNAALENFAEMKSENKIVILGDMLELGNESASEHTHIIQILRNKGIKKAFLVGQHFSDALKSDSNSEFQSFTNAEAALEELKRENVKNHLILIKGSRGIKLEKLLEAF